MSKKSIGRKLTPKQVKELLDDDKRHAGEDVWLSDVGDEWDDGSIPLRMLKVENGAPGIIKVKPQTRKSFYSLKKKAALIKRHAEKLGTFKEKRFFYPPGASPKEFDDDGFMRHLLYLQKKEIKLIRGLDKVFGKGRRKSKSI